MLWGDPLGCSPTLGVPWGEHELTQGGWSWPEALRPTAHSPPPVAAPTVPPPVSAPVPNLMLSPYSVAAPVRFLRELQAQEVDEGATAHLRCELSHAGASVEWRKGSLQLFPCAKYQMVQEGKVAELRVRGAEQEDAGRYTCDTGHAQSTASLSVRGELPASPCPPRLHPQPSPWSGQACSVP